MKLLYDLALALVAQNVPYIWGGTCPLVGLDCSGVTHHLLESVGLGGEQKLSASGQRDYWLQNGGTVCQPQLGALAFFGPAKVIHVGFCIDEARMVEAAHGNENCRNRAVSALLGAYVKVSPISRRKDLIDCVLPPYATVFKS